MLFVRERRRERTAERRAVLVDRRHRLAEKARLDLRVIERVPVALQHVGGGLAAQPFAVDQHTVAVEDDRAPRHGDFAARTSVTTVSTWLVPGKRSMASMLV